MSLGEKGALPGAHEPSRSIATCCLLSVKNIGNSGMMGHVLAVEGTAHPYLVTELKIP